MPRETSDKEEMEIHIPSYPLPVEIEQMDRSEKACRYCGVSYLILHEFQCLQKRLQEVEKELEKERGSVERERTVREELQQANSHLEKLKATILQQAEITRALDLQLCMARREMESVRTERKRLCTELENECARQLLLRSRCMQQQCVLREALALLQWSRGEMTTVKSQLIHFLENWENSKTLIQQSCISADAEHARLQQEVGGLEAELVRLHGDVLNLKACLDEAREQMLQLENQVQTKKLLQIQNQEAHSLIQGLKEEMKTLKIDLQKSLHERENVKILLKTKSAGMEELRALWMQQSGEMKATIQRLSQDQKEKEERWLSCQQRCESLQEQLLAWQQKEEEVTRRLKWTEGEMKDLRAARSTLQQEREDLRWTHVGELERLEETFRIRLKAAQEHSSKLETCLHQQQAEQENQLVLKETELRREADIELDIQRQKNQELADKYQTENKQLQKKFQALVHSATQELHEELALLQEHIKQQNEETQHIRESTSQREKHLLQERRTGEAQLQSALQDLLQRTQELHKAQRNIEQLRKDRDTLEEEKSLLEETVRRECEERAELTSALTLAKEQLLELKQSTSKAYETQTHTRLSRSTVMHPGFLNPTLHPPTHNRSSQSTQGSIHKGLAEWHSGSVGRNVASWHGTTRPAPTLPKINKDRVMQKHFQANGNKGQTLILPIKTP
ncbi:protein LEKR1 isoform X2 [Xyrauchen texanus]|nr:protein LEKR1 isoform X2 [Xyrauchen texanus]